MSLSNKVPGSQHLQEDRATTTNDVPTSILHILSNLTYHKSIIKKVANLLESYGFLPVEAFEQKDHLTHKGINTFVFWHPNGGEVTVSIALKEDFGESFRTDMTPTIPVKSELFGLSQDLDIVIKIDYMEMNQKDLDIELHKSLTKSLTQAVWG